MKLWWWVGFSTEILERVHSRKSVHTFLDQLAQSFVFLWIFIICGCFAFFIIATHNFFIALCGTLVFGFVQWNVIRLTNASIHIAPHEYDTHLRDQNQFLAEKNIWDALDKETQKKTTPPKEPLLKLPSFFKPSLFFIVLSVLSGMVWGIGLSTDYIVEIKGPPKDIQIYEILERIEQASGSSWMQIGGGIGLLIGCLPSLVRWFNGDILREMYTATVNHDHQNIVALHQIHAQHIQNHLKLPSFATQFFDPPFNQRPKVMGWINAQECVEITVPKWKKEDLEKTQNTQETIDTAEEEENSSTANTGD